MKNIILVEDDPFLLDIYITKFKEAGFNIEVIKEGQKVLETLKKKLPDLLILDIVLPDVDGLEVLKEIRSQDAFKNLPIIILSNLGQKQEVKKGLEMGATKYFIKANYKPSELVEEIKKILI
jgi:DNA-binding response OmpR family regulator